MTDVEGFGAELADFRRRVEELLAARSLPDGERLLSLDAALIELRHVAEVLWPRYEELMAAGRRSGTRSDGQEQQLLRSLFHRLPVPVVVLDKDAVVRRLNLAATQLFGVRAGYAAGRSLTGSLTHEGRPVLRTQVAAVARGEGARSLRVRLLHPDAAPGGRGTGNGRDGGSDPDGGKGRNDGSGGNGPGGADTGGSPHMDLRVTLTALSAPQDARSGVLAVFQPVVASPEGYTADVPPAEPDTTAAPDLDEMSRHSELLDLVDDMTSALLTSERAPEAVAARAASVLHQRFADWVVVDLGDRDALGRAVVLGPDERVREAIMRQDPRSAPLVKDAVENGTAALQARADDLEAFGFDEGGSAVLIRAGVGSLICVPLSTGRRPGAYGAEGDGGDGGAGGQGRTCGVLTLFRTGRGRVFELSEAGAVQRIARHIALAMGS
ncbi:PAS domain-containing protein [Streptomyces marispadix]|uniref:PAS domain-containing protein n=1 Tax=Streptomyces marispadix TaxID=2922868 RepID=A0ABS9T4J2_9ACTN|nr:PAS domain-containing protein [Streptomyces marispadix]MCH6163436.1 PAS domain-containing protein [Streptomyces marispadix]